MLVRVVTAPQPIVTPGDIPGSHAGDDPAVARMIAAAQRTIDGPSGWLGRALGKQTLEVWMDWFPCGDAIRLFGPVMSITSVKYLDVLEQVQDVEPTAYRTAGDDLLFRNIFARPGTAVAPDAVRITYTAGSEIDDVPAEAKEAVILMALHMKAAGSENLFLRSEQVDGVGEFQYIVSDQAGEVIDKAVKNLLSGLRVYS